MALADLILLGHDHDHDHDYDYDYGVTVQRGGRDTAANRSRLFNWLAR